MAVYDEVNNFKKLFKEPRIIGCQNSDFYLHWEKPIFNLATVLRDMKKLLLFIGYTTCKTCALLPFMFSKSAGNPCLATTVYIFPKTL